VHSPTIKVSSSSVSQVPISMDLCLAGAGELDIVFYGTYKEGGVEAFAELAEVDISLTGAGAGAICINGSTKSFGTPASNTYKTLTSVIDFGAQKFKVTYAGQDIYNGAFVSRINPNYGDVVTSASLVEFVAQTYNPNTFTVDVDNVGAGQSQPTTGPVDLVVTDFSLPGGVHNRVGNNADRLLSSTTIKNYSEFPCKAFEVTYYARSDAGPYRPGDLILGTSRGVALKPFQATTIRPDIKDPIYLKNTFTDGYYIGVQIDPGNKIAETDKSNNFMQVSGKDSVDLALDLAVTQAALVAFTGLSLATAPQALSHYLDKTGTDKDWESWTTFAHEVAKGPEFAKSAKAALKTLKLGLIKSYKANGHGFATLDLLESVTGKPLLESDPDLFMTMHGTQGSSGRFTNIQVIPVDQVGKHTVYEFTATLSITYNDVYEFDADDAKKGWFWGKKYIGDFAIPFNEGSCQRHLQMCGLAKPFKDSVTVTTTVNGDFAV
jgi:hypothetical protein